MATRSYSQALTSYRRLEDPAGCARVFHLGDVCRLQGKFWRAEVYAFCS